jgi:hypothetical protein
MRRTVLNATAAACVAVLASTVPAFAHGESASPTTRPSATSEPSARPSAPASTEPSAVPTRKPSRTATPAPTAVPSEGRGQVGAVPSGAPNTGVTTGSNGSGSDGMLISGGAAGALAVGGAAVFLVRRRRVTGA